MKLTNICSLQQHRMSGFDLTVRNPRIVDIQCHTLKVVRSIQVNEASCFRVHIGHIANVCQNRYGRFLHLPIHYLPEFVQIFQDFLFWDASWNIGDKY